ncbi:MAG: GFA family protein [Steroidobacter sp.]
MKVHGKCHCGQVSYEAEIDPEKVSLCHCADCQMLTGSAYRVNVPASKEMFILHTGELASYIKTADSGNKRRHAFCPTCGTPVYSSAVTDPQSFSLRTGCLDERAQLPPKRQIWCDSAVPWSMDLHSVPKFARQQHMVA